MTAPLPADSPDTCLHGLEGCETCAHSFGKQWAEPPGVTEGYTAHPNQDFADSVGMPLHERFRP
jgi:hypothetical protein